MLGGPEGVSNTVGQKTFGLWVQDNWKLTSRLTVNIGLRYDLDLGWYNQAQYAANRTYLVLKAIGSPYGNLPQTPTKDFSPRLGFAWDITGGGKNVLRASFGIYFDGMYAANNFAQGLQEKPTLANLFSTFTNTSVGVGSLEIGRASC